MFSGNSKVEVQCPHCDVNYLVPTSMKGGLANCPDCRKAVPVRSGPESLFWILVAVGVLVSLFFVVTAYFTVGIIGAGVVLAMSVVFMTIAILMC